jgi:hypothetical protein
MMEEALGVRFEEQVSEGNDEVGVLQGDLSIRAHVAKF